MFYRFISEKLANYINQGEWDAGHKDFDYAKLSDEDAAVAKEGLVEEQGFFLLPSELFCNIRANASKDEYLNETLEKVFNHIEDSAKGSDAICGGNKNEKGKEIRFCFGNWRIGWNHYSFDE